MSVSGAVGRPTWREQRSCRRSAVGADGGAGTGRVASVTWALGVSAGAEGPCRGLGGTALQTCPGQ